MKTVFLIAFWLVVIGAISYFFDSGMTFIKLYLGLLFAAFVFYNVPVLFNYLKDIKGIRKYFVFSASTKVIDFQASLLSKEEDFKKIHDEILSLGFLPNFSILVESHGEDKNILMYTHEAECMH